MTFKGITLRRLAILLGHRLREGGVDAVLTGGACVSLYTRNRYPSFDLDFVLAASDDRKAGEKILAGLGFRRDGRHFRHPETPYIVEFLLPPLSIGSEPVRRPAEMKSGRMTLRLLSPTDCVKDRLAAFYFWRDRQSLTQACAVAARVSVDLADIERWSGKEGMDKRYAIFKNALGERRAARRRDPR